MCVRPSLMVCVALWFVCLARGTAVADEDPEALIRQGNEVRKKGDDAKAYGYFKRAYDIAHTPRSAAQLGLVEQALGQHLDAHEHFAEALSSRDPWVAKNRAVLEKSSRSVEGELGRIEIHGAPAGATVEVSGRAPVAVPADGTVWVTPGDVAVRVAAHGQEALKKQVMVVAGAVVAIDVPVGATGLAPPVSPAGSQPPPPPTAPADGGGQTPRLAGVVTAGVGVALGVAGIFVYRSGASKRDAIEQAARQGVPYDDGNGNYRTLGNAGIAMMAAGGVAVAAGAALFLLNREHAGPSVGVAYAPGTGGTIGVAGRF